MIPIESWSMNGETRLRYLDNGGTDGPPIVFVPGIVDLADDYHALLDHLLPRRTIVVELRGRGRSSWPKQPDADFSAQVHADDVESVLATAAIARFHLMTFSRGTTYALETFLRAPSRVITLSIGDYWAREHRVDPAITDDYMTGRFRGKPLVERIHPEVVRGIFTQSRDRDLLPRVAATGAPLLIAVGTEADRIIKEPEIDEIRSAVPSVRVVTIHGAGHDLFKPDRLAYPRAVADFVGRHDGP